MANGFKNFSQANTCPICGKPDWCSWREDTNMIICMRDDTYLKGDVFTGIDGKTYECKGQNKEGHNFFFLHEDCERWRETHKISKGAKQQKETAFKRQIPKTIREDDVKPIVNEKLHKIYSYLLQSLKLEEADRNYLYSEGFTDELIERYQIRSLPEPDYYRFQNKDYKSVNKMRKQLAHDCADIFGDLTGVPGFYQEKDKNGNNTGEWNISGLGGILFPLIDPFKNIYRLRVRVYRPNVGSGKYRNFSSYAEEIILTKDEKISRNRYLNGCSSGNNCGLYSSALDDYTIVFLTEGEKKGIISNAYFHYPVVTLPGVNSYKKILEPIRSETSNQRLIDFLKQKGTKIIIVAFDADKNVNDAVLNNEKQTISTLRAEGFSIATAEWDMSLGKGLDDLLVAGYKPRFKLYKN